MPCVEGVSGARLTAEACPNMRIGSFIVIVLSLIATAFSVAVTAVGWERILFYTGWMSSSFVYPASILLYILLFGLAMMRCRTITRAAGASLIASVAALISAVDQYYGGPLVAMMTGWFGMQSIIVEETSLNIIAVLGGVLWPLLYTVTLFIATLFTKRRVPRYLK